MLDSVLNSSDLKKLNARVEIFQGSTSTPTYVCTCADFLESFAVYREGDKTKFFGFGICHKLDCKLIDFDRVINIHTGDVIEISFGNLNNADLWDYPFPKLYVTDYTNDEKNNTISLTAHDKLYFASGHFIEELDILGKSTTPRAVFQRCAEALGLVTVDLSEANLVNALHTDTPNFSGDEDLRMVLNSVAEVTGNIYFMGNDNALKLKAVKTSEVAVPIDKAQYYELEVKEPVVLKSICSTTELGENLEPPTDIEEGVTQYIKENPFLSLAEDAASMVDNIASVVLGTTLWQFDCDWEGNHLLEIGDCVSLERNDGSKVTSVLLNDTLTYAGALGQVTEWEFTQDNAETATNSTTLGDKINETYAKVNKLEKNITLYVGEVVSDQIDDATESLETRVASLELTTDGINATVSQVQTIVNDKADSEELNSLRKEVNTKVTSEQVEFIVTSELAEGVDKIVTTSKHYTFDDEGLNITSSDSNISTTITEDGMNIYRQSEAVLVANNEGVLAEDLHATTYLIIGNNSRFEDYVNIKGEARTACFWMGG